MLDDDQTIATTSDCSVDNGPSFDMTRHRRRIERKKKCQNYTIWITFVIGMIVLATIICIPIAFLAFGYGQKGRGDLSTSWSDYEEYFYNYHGGNNNIVLRTSLEEIQNYIITNGYSRKEDVLNYEKEEESMDVTNNISSNKDENDDEKLFSFNNNTNTNNENDNKNDNIFRQRRNPSTSQYLASKFMMTMELPSNEIDTILWKERYVAAVLYYALGGSEWEEDYYFVTHNRHICQWNKRFRVYISSGSIRTMTFGIDCGNPRWAYLHNVPLQIERIRLVRNNLISVNNTGIPWRELRLLSKLESLDLQDNPGIGGTLPFDDGTLPQEEKEEEDSSLSSITTTTNTSFWPPSLLDIWLSNINLTGTIPNTIFTDIPNLYLIEMSHNQLTGTIPSSITQATNLEAMALEHNYLEGSLHSIEELISSEENNKLELLHLGDNMLQYELKTNSFVSPSSILERLDLSDNPSITGTVPIELLCNTNTNNVHLEVLDLHGTNITSFPDIDDEEFKNFTSKMEFLALFANPNLRQPEFPMNIITKCMKSSLKHLDLTSTSMGYEQGMPTEIGLLSNLEYLFLADTKFLPGPVPYEYTTMNELKDLSLKHSSRTGTLPSTLFTNPNSALTLLDLDANMLTGTLSGNDEHSLWSNDVKNENMKYLLLNRNNFTGTIPLSTMLFSLPNLQLLQLSDNMLTGTINTRTISNMRNLYYLFLQGNKELELSNSMEELCYVPIFLSNNNNQRRRRNWRIDCGNSSCPCCSCCYLNNDITDMKILTTNNNVVCQDQYDDDFDWLAQYSDPTWQDGYERPIIYTSGSGSRGIPMYGFDNSNIIERETNNNR